MSKNVLKYFLWNDTFCINYLVSVKLLNTKKQVELNTFSSLYNFDWKHSRVSTMCSFIFINKRSKFMICHVIDCLYAVL